MANLKRSSQYHKSPFVQVPSSGSQNGGQGVAQNKKYEILNGSSAKPHRDTRKHMNPTCHITPHQGSP